MRLNFMCFWVPCEQCNDKDACDIDWDKIHVSTAKAFVDEALEAELLEEQG